MPRKNRNSKKKVQTAAGGNNRQVAVNRKALYDYEILDRVEAGLVLTGTEIKSIRAGKVDLRDAFARVQDGELWLHGAHIAPYDAGSYMNHEPRRPRKLLVHRSQMSDLAAQTAEKGLTLAALRLYLPPCEGRAGRGAGEATIRQAPHHHRTGTGTAGEASVERVAGVIQGNRVLSEEDFAQVVLVPSGVEPLALNAYFQGAFVFQPVVPNLPQRGQVLRSMVLAHSALVFPKGHVQGPVQRVFDAPVASDGSQELFCWGWQAADVVAGLTYATRSSLTMAHHPDGRLQLGPLPLGVQIIQAVRRRDGPAFPPFHPSVSLVHGPCIIVRHPVKTPGLGSLELWPRYAST